MSLLDLQLSARVLTWVGRAETAQCEQFPLRPLVDNAVAAARDAYGASQGLKRHRKTLIRRLVRKRRSNVSIGGTCKYNRQCNSRHDLRGPQEVFAHISRDLCPTRHRRQSFRLVRTVSRALNISRSAPASTHTTVSCRSY